MIFFGPRLKPAWIFKSDKKVWRILPAAGMLVIELRDTERKSTEFIGLELSSGSVLWRNEQMEEKWWTTLNIIYKDSVLLQQFVRPDMPTPGKVFVLDLHTGRLLWQNHDVSFLSASDDIIFCSKKTFTSEEIVGLEFRTGAERKIEPPDLPDEDSDPLPGLILPEPVDPEERSRENRKISESSPQFGFPPGAIHPNCLKCGEGNVLGFYAASGVDEKGATLYSANLLVTRVGGKILYRDTVDENIYVPLADFYFAFGGKLIYARNSSEIVAVTLD